MDNIHIIFDELKRNEIVADKQTKINCVVYNVFPYFCVKTTILAINCRTTINFYAFLRPPPFPPFNVAVSCIFMI